MNPAIDELAQRDQWVAHDASKMPIGPDGNAASSTDPSTWMSLEEARRVQRAYGLAGVGFVMSPDDDYIGVDLDNAVDVDGTVKPWAESIVCQLTSYTEISPSGTGLHVWVRGGLPGGGRQKEVDDGRLEVYEKARYFTVTGRHLPGTPDDITVWGGTIGEWYWSHFDPPTVTVEEGTPFEVDEDLDQEILNALEWIPSHDYHTWVAVGFAIKDHFGDAGFEAWRQWSATAKNYCGDDKAWRKYRSFGGKKGITYKTILHLAQENGFETSSSYLSAEDIFPGIHDFVEAILQDADSGEDVNSDEGTDRTMVWDASELRERTDEREYLLDPNIAGKGDVIVMAGPPKSMKSFITLDMLTHFACGEAWHGLRPQRPLRSLMLNYELHIDAVGGRMKALGKAPPPGELYVTDRIRGEIGGDIATQLADLRREREPIDILVIDPIANMFTGDSENDNKAMMRFLGEVSKLRDHLIGPDGILWLVHHARKSKRADLEADPFNSFRGASALRGFYDTGIAVWEKESGTRGVAFELRNGRGKDRLEIEFDQGIFHEVVDHGSVGSDFEIMQAVMSFEAFESQRAAAVACREKEQIIRGDAQSISTWKRRVWTAIERGLVEEYVGGIRWSD